MTRSITAAAFVAVASLLAQASPQQASPAPQTQAPVFRAGADVVSVEASVRRDRRAVTSADIKQQLCDTALNAEIGAHAVAPVRVRLAGLDCPNPVPCPVAVWSMPCIDDLHAIALQVDAAVFQYLP